MQISTIFFMADLIFTCLIAFIFGYSLGYQKMQNQLFKNWQEEVNDKLLEKNKECK